MGWANCLYEFVLTMSKPHIGAQKKTRYFKKHGAIQTHVWIKIPLLHRIGREAIQLSSTNPLCSNREKLLLQRVPSNLYLTLQVIVPIPLDEIEGMKVVNKFPFDALQVSLFNSFLDWIRWYVMWALLVPSSPQQLFLYVFLCSFSFFIQCISSYF